MSFAALRAPARRVAFSNASRVTARARPAYRKYSTTPTPPPAAKSSNALIYGGLGALALAGAGFYIYSSQSDTAREAGSAARSAAQSAKSLANFVPTKEDYQKVGKRPQNFHLG
jgi:cytochrome c peroxidase